MSPSPTLLSLLACPILVSCHACAPKPAELPPAQPTPIVGSVSAAPSTATPSASAPVAPAVAQAPAAAANPKFRCTLVLGLTVTAEWFNAGFESRVDNHRWEARLRPHTFVNDWANPDHEAWREPVASPCAERPESPDRVVVFVADWKLLDAAAWKQPLAQLVGTLKGKYPELRRIELMTMLRAPKNQSCGDPKSVVEPFVDRALREAAAANPELVTVGPVLEVPSCDVFEKGGPHFVEGARPVIAKLVAGAYAE